MTTRHDPAPADIERALERYLVEQRMTRRDLLERIAKVGAGVALAPIVAACSGAAVASAPPSPSAPASVAPVATTPASPSAAPTPVPTPEKELNVYNWDAYIADDTAKKFEAKYGIKVRYDKFPDADTQMTKIKSDGKGAGYDITYPASTEIASLAKDGVILKLDPTLIPNAKNLGAEWANPDYDPNNGYSMPYMWWTTGYAWNPDKVPGDLTSWEKLWDPSLKQHLAMLDDSREVFAVGAFRLGLSPNTTNEAELDQILDLLKQQKPLLRKYTEDDIGDLTSGQLWITHAWSGDWYQMTADAPKTKYVVPAEGAVRGSDTMVVLSGAKHPIAAQLWIDFNLDAQVSAANSNFIGYMGPNAAAQELIDPTIKDDPRINPGKGVQDKLVELLYMAPTDLDKYTQRWNSLRA
ncbi:MAG: PotD/PotF family extracellular solute-binding protein [Chloroflexota bacterium]